MILACLPIGRVRGSSTLGQHCFSLSLSSHTMFISLASLTSPFPASANTSCTEGKWQQKRIQTNPSCGITELGRMIDKYTFFFIRTPNFLPRLDVLIFSAISASNVLIDVLKYLTIKIRYLYSTTVYLLLNTIVFSLNYKMK